MIEGCLAQSAGGMTIRTESGQEFALQLKAADAAKYAGNQATVYGYPAQGTTGAAQGSPKTFEVTHFSPTRRACGTGTQQTQQQPQSPSQQSAPQQATE